MSEVIKGPWPDCPKRTTPAKVAGSDWAMGLVQVQQGARAAAFRPLTATDQQLLWRWLHLALWDPPPAAPRPQAVLEDPETRIYAEDWGRPTDFGIVAVVDGKDAGACWLRLLPAGIGLACVDALTPQLGIALEPEYRRRGIGGTLIRKALQEAWDRGAPQVALTVHPRNPASALYEACGFSQIGERGSYHLMLARAPR
jgi:GNAT superfamily N-acetyltransferase